MTGVTRKEIGNFSMNCQEQSQWCWAAVAQAVELAFGSPHSQTDIVSRHIDPKASLCATCNPQGGTGSPHSLTKVLTERGRLPGGVSGRGVPPFATIVRAIDGGRPLPLRIQWGAASGHFICVSGYVIKADASQWVVVHDPLLPTLGAAIADAQDLPYMTLSQQGYRFSDLSTGRVSNYYEVA